MNKTLKTRLEGVNVCWIPQAIDGAFCCNSIISLIRRLDGVEDGPEVLLLTDDRWASFDRNFRKVAEDLRGSGLSLGRAKKYAALEGLDNRLCMVPPKAEDDPAPGEVVEYRIDGGSGHIVSVILVNAESVEFYLKCLKEWKAKVDVICCNGYHIGFNGCQTTSWWLPGAAGTLGTRYVFADSRDDALSSAGPLGDNDLSLQMFPELSSEPRARLEPEDVFSDPDTGIITRVFRVNHG